MNKKAILIFGISVLILISFSLVTAQKSAVTPSRTPIPIPTEQIRPVTPPLAAGAKDYCYLTYAAWMPAYWANWFKQGDKIAVYYDPDDCGFSQNYPFQLTDVHLMLYDYAAVGSVTVQFSVEVTCPDICDGPGIEIWKSQPYSIVDFYPDPVEIWFEDTVCLDKPFFFNVEYLSDYPEGSMPSFMFEEPLDSGWPDTCYQWVWYGQPSWIEWYNDLGGMGAGWIILGISGYVADQASCGWWYFKPDTLPQAPSGMPDFDQNQRDWVAYCGPTAVANCLWWFDAVPTAGMDPADFIELLAGYFSTTSSGTFVDSIQAGLERYFEDYGFALTETTYWMPDFYEMEDSLKKCQDIILLLGFWWYEEGPEQEFIRGDVNADGFVATSDISTFISGPPYMCDDAADVNDDGAVDNLDSAYLWDFIFYGGPYPPAPYPDCGVDPTADGLDCADFPPCPGGGPGEWFREGGHFVTMAGVNSEKKEIAISDPDRDQCVRYAWWPGRVRTADHLPWGAYDGTYHNDPQYVSHDVYISLLFPEFPSPGSDIWDLADYCYGQTFPLMNVPQRFEAYTRAAPKHFEYFHTEVEAAVMICPKSPPDTLRNHFKTWRVEPEPFTEIVFVEDQFMSDTLFLESIEFFSNPARKDTFEIVDEFEHLTWYRAQGRNTWLEVEYTNQFGTYINTIDSVKYLLLPTAKETYSFPDSLDHYKAYRIKDPVSFDRDLVLEDQFDIMFGDLEFIVTLKPTYFLTPALKNAEQEFIRGDVNADGWIDALDLGALMDGPPYLCDDAADVNDDGALDNLDSAYLWDYILYGGGPPPPPFPDCGVDPTADGLDCADFPPCPPGSSGWLFDSVTHYVAYEIFPQHYYGLIQVQTDDQFGQHFLQVDTSKFLLVPTVKLQVTPPNDPPVIGQPDFLEGYVDDVVSYDITGSDPNGDVILDAASIDIQPGCGSWNIVRISGHGTSSGVWEITWDTEGCTPCDTHMVIHDLTDEHGATGYCTTWVHLSEYPWLDHKMHYPQLPDLEGWDVFALDPKTLADDWQCSETGWVTDIHFWGSWKDIDGDPYTDDFYTPMPWFRLSIHRNIPASADTPWSRPGEQVWFWEGEIPGTPYEPPAMEHWFNPNTEEVLYNDHVPYWRYDFLVEQPSGPVDSFFQYQDSIYWLDVSAVYIDTPYQWGWKSSRDHFMDDAVYTDTPPDGPWYPLVEPPRANWFDVYFNPAGEPIDMGSTNYYGEGWYQYEYWWNMWFYNNPFVTNPKHIWLDFYVEEVGPAAYVEFAVNWSTDLWSIEGVPGRPPLPGEDETIYIGRQIFEVFPGSNTIDFWIDDYNPEWVSIDFVGADVVINGWIWHECVPTSMDLAFVITGHPAPPNDPPEIGQPDFLEGHVDDIVSYDITGSDPNGDVILDDASIDIQPGCGSWNIVRLSGHGTSSGVWEITWDTEGCTPCDTHMVIHDLTDEYGATGYCTTWVHLSEEPWLNHKMHFPQLPDLEGWDVFALDPKTLADDWQCSETGWVTDIHFWGSWKDLDGDPYTDDFYTPMPWFRLSIHRNIPASADTPWSRPGEQVWFWEGEIQGTPYEPPAMEHWFNPNTGEVLYNDHVPYWRYDFFVDQVSPPADSFFQYQDSIYWLDVSAVYIDTPYQWGWKSSRDHFMDDAVYTDTPPGGPWYPLFEPPRANWFDVYFGPDSIPEDQGSTNYYGNGWYRYEWWWNMWFYDNPFVPNPKHIWLEFYVDQMYPHSWATFAINWSTDLWATEGVPGRPPLPGEDETLYIGRQIFEVFPGNNTIDFWIDDYNPEWVSIDFVAQDVMINGWIWHECVQTSMDLAFVITGHPAPPNNPPEIEQPDFLEGFVDDTLEYEIGGTDPDGHIILDSASIDIQPGCGTYSITRTSGHGTSSGTWQITWLTTGCTPCDTHMVIHDLTDQYGATGYCTTWVHLSRERECDDNDPHECDTLYVECGNMLVPPGGGLVEVDMTIAFDESLKVFQVPLSYQGSPECCDSMPPDENTPAQVFAGSIVPGTWIQIVDIDHQAKKVVVAGAALMPPTDCLMPGRGHLGTLTLFGDSCCTIQLDTTDWSGNHVGFMDCNDPSMTLFYPVCRIDTCHIDRNYPPVIGQPDFLEGLVDDVVEYDITGTDPDGDAIEDDASIDIQPGCGSWNIVRTSGHGTSSGTWRITWDTYDCTPCDTHIVIHDLRDVLGAVSYCTTWVHLSEPESLYWKPPYEDYAPNGMVDIDQKQDGWLKFDTEQWSFCGPCAVANCFKWFDSKYNQPPGAPGDAMDQFPLVRDYTDNLPAIWLPTPWDDHSPENVDHTGTPWGPGIGPPPPTPQPFVPGPQPPPVIPDPWGELVERLAWYFDTDGIQSGYCNHTGTNVLQMQQGIQDWLDSEMFVDSSTLADTLCMELTPRPTFAYVESLVEKCEDVILLLGFWYEEPEGSGVWFRIGGHYVTVAGVNSERYRIAFSDPFIDAAEFGAPGRIGDGMIIPHSFPHDPTVHNDEGNVSHDIYTADTASISPGGDWWLPDYAINGDPGYWSWNFYAQNVPDEFHPFTMPWNGTSEIFTEVEYCIHISPWDYRGDVAPTGGNGVLDVGDAVYILNWLFKGGPAPSPMIEGDTTCDGIVNLSDAIRILNYLFKGWPIPRCCDP